MLGKKNRKQELYDRIRKSSKDAVILEEMERLGFWPKAGTMPEDPADSIRRKGELRQELNELRSQQSALQNTERMLRDIKKQRMKESRARQKENRERKERERIERAAAWKEKKSKEIVYLGEQVSGGINEVEGDSERLESLGLPYFKNGESIAQAMNITINTLRFLSYNRQVSTTTNYVDFVVPKKTGGVP